ncbi:hypothetical protein RHMOL_Rhmol01G0033700 [Rhododendron molle]|uniref:Uncharacterized protein n=1 Tax=Rhododendron molle TaxID=49168 RepID=A0ACC0Q0L5_RHOML|nr:hypothetical protein RHMOL_Rhmol01G0033700 [Rhododendron molle]
MLFTIISLLLFLPSLTSSSESQTWIKAGYWHSGSDLPIPGIDSTLFTHLTCAFAHINSSTYELSISSSDEPYISTFTDVVRRKNPSIITLLSIWAGDSNFSIFFSMATQPSHRTNFTGAHSALYDPSSNISTDYGIKEWISRGLPADKMVLGLAYHGYAWTLVDPTANEIGSPARGRAVTLDGSMFYKFIKSYMKCYGERVGYNSTYVTNYCITGSVWIGYDDVEAIRTKVSYARETRLLGYKVWQVCNDDNWVLSKAAQEDEKDPRNKRQFLLLVILLPTATTVTLLLVFVTLYLRKRARRSKGWMGEGKELQSLLASVGNANDPNLLVFSLTNLVEATNNFSFENKLGEGGYGPVYEGVLHYGQEIAVKKLSRTSTQGFEEFKNEIMLITKLQHVNLTDYLPIPQAYDLWKCGKGMEFMDPSLDDTNSSCKLVRCMQIALLCVQENPADRPSMLELSSMLKNETAAMNTPKRPAFSIRRDEDEVQESTSQQEIWSVGDVSFTQTVAR